MDRDSTAARWLGWRLVGGAIVAACAVAYARFVLGAVPLDIHDLHWLWGDLAQVHIAWSQFVSDPDAHWLTSTRLSYPLPLSISLFDPMPLLLLLARPFAGLVPEGTQYFGYYFAACVLLQGVFGYLATLRAVRIAGGDRGLAAIWIAVAGGVFFASIPYTFYRFQGHTALSSQWVLVLSTWVSLTSLDWRRVPWIVSNGAVLFVATGLNPYLALMVLISCGILTVMAWQRLRLIEVGTRVVALSFVAIVGLWLFGFTSGAAADSGGYGHYSMNLFGPLDSHHMAKLFPFDVPDATTEQQFEGYTYVGFGLVLLWVCGLMATIARKQRAVRFPFVAVLLVTLCCSLLALSATISAGAHAFEIPLPKPVLFLLSRFRGSGRLFWIAGFWLILASVAACVRRIGSARTAALVSVLLVVQLVDIHPIASQVSKTLAGGKALRLEGIPDGRFSAILVFPAWQCDNQATPGGGVRNYEAVGFLAASRGVPTNSFYAARTPAEQTAYHCDYAARFAEVDARALYLLSGPMFADHRDKLLAAHACSDLPGHSGEIMCTPKALP
jgi:hypothetical protein